LLGYKGLLVIAGQVCVLGEQSVRVFF